MAVFVPGFRTHFLSVSFKPSRMSARPTRKIVPTAKLTTENAGELLLTSHRNAVASASASLAVPPPPTSLRPSLVSNLATPTPPATTSRSSSVSVTSSLITPTDLDMESSDSSPDPASSYRVQSSTKRPCPRPTIDSDGNTTDAEDTHKTKKAKTTSRRGLQTDVSIISINDVDDP